jgi:hypothetical protein
MHINEIIKYGEIKPGGKLLLTPEQLNDAIAFIKRRCKKILEDYRKTNRIFYRGTYENGSNIFIGKPFNDRRPRDTDRRNQKLIDDKLSKMGFTALRKNSIFVTASGMDIAHYGDRFVIFPIDGFSYMWTPAANDLTAEYSLSNYYEDSNSFQEDLHNLTAKEFVDKYKFKNNVGIYNALRSSSEVCIHGAYIAIRADELSFPIIMYELFGDATAEKIILSVLRATGNFLKYIINPTEKMILTACASSGVALKYVKNPSRKLILYALKHKPAAIEFVTDQDEEMQLFIARHNAWLFRYLKNPSEKVKEIAVSHEPRLINSIKNPSEKLKKIALQNAKDPWVLCNLLQQVSVSDKLISIAIKSTPDVIEFIKFPTKEMQMAAVSREGLVLRFFKNQASPEVQLAAVTQNPSAIMYIQNPSEEIQIAAVTAAPFVVYDIPHACAAAIKIAQANGVKYRAN